MFWSRESEADYLARICEELDLPEDDDGRERLKEAIDAIYDSPPMWMCGAHRQLRGRLVERFIERAIGEVHNYVNSETSNFAQATFRTALVVLASDDGLVSVRERGLKVGIDTGAYRTIDFDHVEGPVTMDVAIWLQDETDPDHPYGRTAVFIRRNNDLERIFEAVLVVLRQSGWDVRVLSIRDVETDPVGVARSLLGAPVPAPPPEAVAPLLMKGPEDEQ